MIKEGAQLLSIRTKLLRQEMHVQTKKSQIRLLQSYLGLLLFDFTHIIYGLLGWISPDHQLEESILEIQPHKAPIQKKLPAFVVC